MTILFNLLRKFILICIYITFVMRLYSHSKEASILLISVSTERIEQKMSKKGSIE